MTDNYWAGDYDDCFNDMMKSQQHGPVDIGADVAEAPGDLYIDDNGVVRKAAARPGPFKVPKRVSRGPSKGKPHVSAMPRGFPTFAPQAGPKKLPKRIARSMDQAELFVDDDGIVKMLRTPRISAPSRPKPMPAAKLGYKKPPASRGAKKPPKAHAGMGFALSLE